MQRLCKAVPPNDEPCDYPATVHCAKCGRWFCDADAEDEEWHPCMLAGDEEPQPAPSFLRPNANGQWMRWHAQHGRFILGSPKFSQRFVPLFLWNNSERLGTSFDQNLLLLWLLSINRRRRGNRIISVYGAGDGNRTHVRSLGSFYTAIVRRPLSCRSR